MTEALMPNLFMYHRNPMAFATRDDSGWSTIPRPRYQALGVFGMAVAVS
jgi:hypothetical protein